MTVAVRVLEMLFGRRLGFNLSFLRIIRTFRVLRVLRLMCARVEGPVHSRHDLGQGVVAHV
jgi:hypothetical protein